jgi:hypothetical protein
MNLNSITSQWSQKLELMTDDFRKQAEKLREQELEMFKLTKTNADLKANAKRVIEEYEESERISELILKSQDELLKSLGEMDDKIVNGSHISVFNQPKNMRTEIKEKAVNGNITKLNYIVNQDLQKADLMLQAINEQLNDQATHPESDSSYVHIIKSIANNQYDALKAIEDQVYKLEYDLAG